MMIAVVEMMLRLAEVIHAPFYALFLVGPVAATLIVLGNVAIPTIILLDYWTSFGFFDI